MCRLMFCNASDDLDERKIFAVYGFSLEEEFQQGHHFGPSCICCNHTCICIFPASGFAVFFLLQFAFFNLISLHLKTNDQTSFIILLDLCPTIFSIFHAQSSTFTGNQRCKKPENPFFAIEPRISSMARL